VNFVYACPVDNGVATVAHETQPQCRQHDQCEVDGVAGEARKVARVVPGEEIMVCTRRRQTKFLQEQGL